MHAMNMNSAATMSSSDNHATMSLASILENSITHPPLSEWLSSPRDISARLVHFTEPSSSSSRPPSSTDGPARPPSSHTSSRHRSRSVRSTGGASSSMAPACIHQPSHTSTHPPSLYTHSSGTTPTESSISTGLASRLSGVSLLEPDINGTLERRPPQNRPPYFECAFWFLTCPDLFHDEEQWKTHCLSHFRGEEPPRSVTCPLCDEFQYSCPPGADGFEAWELRMEHVARVHMAVGQTLKTSRPDFALYEHLWSKRLIDREDFKELKGGNHNLTMGLPNFVTSGGGRREREERRQRRQHVGVGRR